MRASGCKAESSTRRSRSLMTKGTTRWTTALPRASKSLARLGVQGMSGFLCLSNTKTMNIYSFPLAGPLTRLSDESRQAFLNCSSRPWWKGLLCSEHRPYPCGTFNPERQLHRIEEAFGGAITFPTELSQIPACGIKSRGWTLQGLQRRSAFGLPASPRIESGGS